jgi:hypothetical protein
VAHRQIKLRFTCRTCPVKVPVQGGMCEACVTTGALLVSLHGKSSKLRKRGLVHVRANLGGSYMEKGTG